VDLCWLLRRAIAPKANVKTIAKIPTQFRFWIADFRLSERDFEGNAFIGLSPGFSIQNLKSKIQNVT
jgi:hypothetical protein